MKKNYLFLLLVFISVNIYSQTPWTAKANFAGIARSSAASFSIGSKGYIGTGYDQSGTNLKDFWEWDPSTNAWTQKADFGGPKRAWAVGFSMGTKGYIGTGSDGFVYYSDFWEWDQATNIWTQKANFGGGNREAAIGFSIGSKGYIGTGKYTGNKRDFWEWDPSTDTWTQKVNFGGTGRSSAVAFSIGNYGYIGTGEDDAGFTKDFWEFDPSLNSWIQKANFGGVVRYRASGFSLGTKGYIGNGNGYNKDFWEYNQLTDTWIQKTNYPGAGGESCSGFAIGSMGYLGVGWQTVTKNDFYEYNAANDCFGIPSVSFTTTSDTVQINDILNFTNTTSGASSYTWLHNGVSFSTSLNSSYTFNIAGTDTISLIATNGFCTHRINKIIVVKPLVEWFQKADFGGVVRKFAVGFSIGNKGYIGTGQGSTPSIVMYNDFWEWDTLTNAWTQKANFAGASRYSAAGFSINGKGYICAGQGTANYKDLWEYDPSLNTWIQKANFPGVVRYKATGFSTATKGYLGLGVDASGNYVADFYEYDPGTNSWVQKTNFPGGARSEAVGFSIGNIGYIGTGINSSGTKKDFWQFDPSSNVWTRKADLTGAARYSAAGFSTGSKGYIGTGLSNSSPSKDFWEYNSSTDAWVQKANFSGLPCYGAVGFSIGSRGYIGTGCTGTNTNNTKVFWEYDISNCGGKSVSISSTGSCSAINNGTATATMVGGSAAYTYLWNTIPVQTTQTATGLGIGSYAVTVTDGRGCTLGSAVTISLAQDISSLTTSKINVCNATLGSATVAAAGGTPGYSYSWSTNPVQITQTATGLSAGTYTVTVNDSKNCNSKIDSVTINQSSAIVPTITPTNALCFGGQGSASVNVSGGSPNYTYSWNTTPVQLTQNATGLLAGSYTLTVTDANSCTATAPITISHPTVLSLSTTQTNVCNSTGAATVNASGGTPGYTYSWSSTPVQTTPTATGLPYGTYTVTVTDANACSKTATVTIKSLIDLTTSQLNIFPNSGSTGSATVLASGGSPGYLYSWSSNPVQTTATATGLPTGTYTVTVTDANTCLTSTTVTLISPKPTLISAGGYFSMNMCSGGPLRSWGDNSDCQLGDGTCTQQNSPVLVTGMNSGITTLAAGNNFTMVLKNDGTIWTWGNNSKGQLGDFTFASKSLPVQTVPIPGVIDITAGVFHALALKSDGTVKSWGSNTLGQLGNGSLSNFQYPVSVTGLTNVIAIAAGFFHSVALKSDGTVWAWGQGTLGILGDGTTVSKTTPVQVSGLTNIIAISCGDQFSMALKNDGTVWTWGGNAYGCLGDGASLDRSIPVQVHGPGNVGFLTGITSIAAGSGHSLAIKNDNTVWAWGANASGQLGDGTTTNRYTPVQVIGLNNIVSIEAGGHTLAIKNDNSLWMWGPNNKGQLGDGTTVLKSTPFMAACMAINISSTNVTCSGNNNGTATANVAGCASPFTYLWNTTPAKTTQTVSGLASGTYTVTATDVNGCSGTNSVTITQPVVLASSVSSQTNVYCNGSSTGSATVSVSGGTFPYTYTWSPIGGTNSSASGLAAGTYTCTIKDANLCTKTQTVVITQQPALTTSLSQTNVSCNGLSNGSAAVTASGGTAPYTYSWSPGGSTASSLTGLVAGTYTCIVKDFRLCTKIQTVVITEPGVLLAGVTQTNSCAGSSSGSVTITAIGGTGPYTYSWSPGGSSASSLTGLAAGNYTCTITDGRACTKAQNITIAESATPLTSSLTSTNLLCNGSSSGTAAITASGGTGPYTYLWSPSGGTGASANGLTAGTYTCTITDNYNCIKTEIATLTQPSALLSTIISQTNVSVDGGNDGDATISVSGGTAPYSYSWTPYGGTSTTASGLVTGSYTCTITDANGCIKTHIVYITEPSSVSLALALNGQNNISCKGGNDGTATISAAGGVAPYSYSWFPFGGNNATANNLTAGSYTCTVTDAAAQSQNISVVISEPNILSASAFSTDVICSWTATGSSTVIVSGGTSPYTYSWAPFGGTSSSAYGLPVGTYTCTITDNHNCIKTATITVNQPLALSSTLISQSNVSVYGGNDGNATISASGGTAPYSYSWAPSGGTSTTASGLSAGSYTCTITDTYGCTKTHVVNITQPSTLPLVLGLGMQNNVSCNGGSNGAVTISATGGTAPYSYSWLPSGGNNATANNLTAGSYTCTVTDAAAQNQTISVIISEPSMLSASVSSTDVNCNGAATGSSSLTVSGGTSPYTYSWSPSGGTNVMATGLSAGTYTCVVTDANYCQQMVTAAVNQPSVLATSISSFNNLACSGSNNGNATVMANGGTSPYLYSWSPSGGNNAMASSLDEGTYSCVVTDQNGCSQSSSVTIAVNNSISVLISSSGPTTFCSGGNVTLSADPGFLSYNWHNGNTSQSYIANSTEIDSVTVTDINGCTATSGPITITVNPSPVLVITNPAPVCYPSTIDFSLPGITSGSTAGNIGYWTDAAATIPLDPFYLFNTDTTVTFYFKLENAGCSDTKPVTGIVSRDCVWPGDADKDMTVNNNDVLPIGLFYSQTGTPRASINNNFQSFLADNWGTLQTNNVDIKHVDCNGDGIINDNDTLAISQNFNYVHTRTANDFNYNILTSPDIYILTSNSSYVAGDWVNAEVWVGNSTQPVNNLYGVAFNINFDGSLIQSGTGGLVFNDSWLGTPYLNTLPFSKMDWWGSVAYGAITRIDHINANGFGKIAEFKFQTTTTITSSTILYLSVAGYLANDKNGIPLIFNAPVDSVTINPLTTGVPPSDLLTDVTIKPNPFTYQTTIVFNDLQKHAVIKIIDVVGKEIRTIEFSGKQYIIERNDMPNGIYFFQITDENKNVINRRVIIQ